MMVARPFGWMKRKIVHNSRAHNNSRVLYFR